MSDPNETGAGLSVTIKFPESARYKADNPWIVFHGSVDRIRTDIISAFGMDESANMLALSDLTVEAQTLATAMKTVAGSLGGRPLGPQAGGSSEAFAQARAEQAAPSEPEPELTLEQRIEKAETIDALREMWVDFPDIKADEALTAAWKAKGRSIQEAAA